MHDFDKISNLHFSVSDGYSVDLAVIKDAPKCVYKNNNTEYADHTFFVIKLEENIQPLPDSRYITLRRDLLSVKVYEIRIVGGTFFISFRMSE